MNAALVSNRESTADTERTTMSKFESTGESPPDAMASDQAHASHSLPEIELGALAARLKLLIGDHSVAFFARKCGMAESVLRTYLNDRRMPSLDKAWAIAAAGGVTLDWLATGRGRRVTAQVGGAYATDSKSVSDVEEPQTPSRPCRSGGHPEGCPGSPGDHATPEHIAALTVALYQRAMIIEPRE